MKDHALLVFFIIQLILSSGCETKLGYEQVPVKIRGNFEYLYGKTTEVFWTRELNSYEASFLYNERNMKVSFDMKGNQIEQVMEIKESEVPIPVIKAANKHNQKGQIKNFNKDIWKNKTLYLVEMEINKKHYNVYFSPEGRLIKKVAKLK